MRVVLFGTGSGLSDLLCLLPPEVTVVGLCDNDGRKHGTTVSGHSVYAPDAIDKLDFEYVVITTRQGEEIRHQLVGMGMDRKRILLFYSNFESRLKSKSEPGPRNSEPEIGNWVASAFVMYDATLA